MTGKPKGKCYLAGPMRGIENYNYPAFKQGAELLRRWGWEVFSPAENDLAMGFDPTETEPSEEFLRRALALDLQYICLEADAVFLLPGWENSKGATAEFHTAMAVGIDAVLPWYWFENVEPDVAGGDLTLV